MLDCPFCQLDRTTIASNANAVAVHDAFPVSRGHALILPKRHVPVIWELSEDEFADCFALVRIAQAQLQLALKPDGFNVGVNCGIAAGQSVWHAHIHLIPRYSGDVANPRGGVRNVIPFKGDY
jgi:diadenosine tetraphosphate (Ap4A) HIT family hydrolase